MKLRKAYLNESQLPAGWRSGYYPIGNKKFLDFMGITPSEGVAVNGADYILLPTAVYPLTSQH